MGKLKWILIILEAIILFGIYFISVFKIELILLFNLVVSAVLIITDFELMALKEKARLPVEGTVERYTAVQSPVSRRFLRR